MVDAFLVRERVKAESGGSRYFRFLRRKGRTSPLTAQGGDPLKSVGDLRIWLAARSLNWARWGFLLMAAGFGLDIYGKIFG